MSQAILVVQGRVGSGPEHSAEQAHNAKIESEANICSECCEETIGRWAPVSTSFGVVLSCCFRRFESAVTVLQLLL